MRSRADYLQMTGFIAITIVLGYIFLAIPNVELVTMTIFLSGYFLGSRKGVLVGIIAEFLFSLLNPYGVASPPLLAAQVISMGIVGYAGGIVFLATRKVENELIKLITFGSAGFLLTLLFDFLTTISFAIFLADTSKKIFASIVSSVIFGMPYYFIHILVNTLIFFTALPLLIRTLTKIGIFKVIS